MKEESAAERAERIRLLNIPHWKSEADAIRFGGEMDEAMSKSVAAQIKVVERLLSSEKVVQYRVQFVLRRKFLNQCLKAYQEKHAN